MTVGRLSSEAEAAMIDGGGLTRATLSRGEERPDVDVIVDRLRLAGYTTRHWCERRWGSWWTAAIYLNHRLVAKASAERLADAYREIGDEYAPPIQEPLEGS